MHMRQAYISRLTSPSARSASWGRRNPKLVRKQLQGEGIVSTLRKAFNVGKSAANTAQEVAFGEVGTAISNTLPSTDANARPRFPGEKHTLLKIGASFGRANYMGPGTQIVKRLQRGPDPPRTVSDKISMRHDIDYALSTSVADVRKADERMIRSAKRAEKAGRDHPFNTAQAIKLITAKTKLEDAGVDPLSFTTFGEARKQPGDKRLLEKERAKLEQEGYGKRKCSRKLPPGLKLKRKLLRQLSHQNGLKSQLALLTAKDLVPLVRIT